ncbi:DUF92 domain-containing protein [Bacillus massiliigorillae]|uniref:DUF92 domain-containing protein n=1 Tax=Bacillus massiliigorillae TaxID=1243664 RepID=UPI0003A85AA4|nr:DUF92 domain-containing protein [Bacillus massiliigorillae]
MIEISAYVVLLIIASVAGYRVRSLSLSGAIFTFITGCLVGLGFGWRGLFILGVFFASSSFWSKYKKHKKSKLDEILQKGDQRDWVQVVANGSIASIAAVLFFVTKADVWMIAFVVAVAAANSDTWASEIGVLSKRKPFYILTGKKVEKGTSGAVSLLGTAASFMGAFFIAIVAYEVFSMDSLFYLILITFCGFFGSVVDTILGATVQVRYSCKTCGLLTEKTEHCGKETHLSKGIKWCNNDVVNITSIIIATIIAVFIVGVL